ncbi:MAG: DUF4145 domain-containing protein [Sphingobacteriia bacterium]|nr:DUF4145 domain-containing protein [Sphingobacteriia bacterium]
MAEIIFEIQMLPSNVLGRCLGTAPFLLIIIDFMVYKDAYKQLEIVLQEIAQIKTIYQRACEKKNTKDFDGCLWTLRNTLEGICKNIYQNEFNIKTDGLDLRNIIKKLEEEKKIPKNIMPHVRTIQTFGNFGSHNSDSSTGKLNEKMIQPPLTSMEVFLNWFISEYHEVPEKPQKASSKQTNILDYIFPTELLKSIYSSIEKIFS